MTVVLVRFDYELVFEGVRRLPPCCLIYALLRTKLSNVTIYVLVKK